MMNILLHLIRFIWRTLLVVLLLAVLLVAIGLGTLQSEYAREKIRALVIEQVSGALGQRVELSPLRGHIPFSLRFARLRISDDDGTWLRVDDFRFAWSPSALLRGCVQLDSLQAGYFCLERVPDFGATTNAVEKAPQKKSQPFELKIPRLMPAVVLRNIGVEQLRLGKAVVGMDAEFEVRVAGVFDREQAGCSLELRRVDGLVDDLSLELALTNGWSQGFVRASFVEQAGGLVALHAGAQYSPVEFSLTGSGPVSNWFGTLRVAVGTGTNRMVLAADYCFSEREQFRLEWRTEQQLVPGQLSGTFQLDGPLRSPVMNMSAVLGSLQLSQLVQMPLAPMNIAVQASLANRQLEAALKTTGIPQGKIFADAVVPVAFSLNPFVLDIGRDSPVKGMLESNLDLSIIAPFLQTFQQNAKGVIRSRIELSGTLTKPDVEGFVKMDDALYENLKIGLLLRDIDLDLGLEKNRLTIRQFKASDTGQGRLRLTGSMTLGVEEEEEMDFHFVMDNAQLVNQTLVSASASADIRIRGDYERIHISGTSVIERVLVNLQEALPPDVTQIEITEINKPGQRNSGDTKQKEEAPAAAKRLDLDITVKAPAKIVVNGRGLTSEWRADIHVGGDAAIPRVTGGLGLVRGYFDFLGKRLTLDQCSVTFDGSWPVVPSLDIRASTTAQNMVAGIRIYGPATAPQISLHSEPSRPDDEILSMMLFGKRPEELSATEALKIAYGLNVLRGGFGAGGFLTKTQQSLGVDQIGIRQGDNDQAQLTVGKYIGKYIYIEGEKSLQGEGDAVKIDFNLTRSIQLKTKASSEAGEGSSVYIRWHNDY